MAMRLLQAKVPAKHLVYTQNTHNDFVCNWRPLPFPHAPEPTTTSSSSSSSGGGAANNGVQPAPSAAGTAVMGREEAADLAELPPFARDLMLILSGRVRVQFMTSVPIASKL